jgi:hypothetical protein
VGQNNDHMGSELPLLYQEIVTHEAEEGILNTF